MQLLLNGWAERYYGYLFIDVCNVYWNLCPLLLSGRPQIHAK